MAKVNFFQKIASYFSDIHLESIESIQNKNIDIYLSKGRYLLTANNAIYSYEDLYKNYVHALAYFHKELKSVNKILILGFGMGSIPVILEKNHFKNYQITGVEHDEDILYFFSKYIQPKLKNNIQLIQGDAKVFTETHTEKYDLICMDIFNNDVIPAEFETKEYLDELSSLLSPNGLLLFNRLYHSGESVITTEKYVKDIFNNKFPEGEHIEITGNWILTNKAVPR